jgi:hypothetical protein
MIAELNQVVKKLRADAEVAAAEARVQQEAAAKAKAIHKEEQAKVCSLSGLSGGRLRFMRLPVLVQ